MKTAADFMSPSIVMVDHRTPIASAIKTMIGRGTTSLLVTVDGLPVGIVTEHDVVTRIDYSNPESWSNAEIASIMTRDIITGDPGDDFLDVIRIMRGRGIRHLPIQEGGSILGLVSQRTLIGHYNETLERLLEHAIHTLSTVVEKRDPYTAGHQRRVAALAVAVGGKLGLNESEIRGLKYAALIHDLGKVVVPSEILSKPGKLNEDELALIRRHPSEGHDIVADVPFPWPIAKSILQHHERPDGKGYPHGLSGGELRIEAKIIAVCDVAEAVASHRPYRPARGIAAAVETIRSGRGSQFDPDSADACLAVLGNADELPSIFRE